VRGCRESYVPGATQLSSIQWIALWVAGRLDEADRLSHGGYRRCLEARADHARGQWCFQLGHCALIRGRARAAADWLQEAVVLLREHDPSRIFALATSSLAHAAALIGDFARADSALEETVRVLPHERSWVELSRAWVTALRGDVEGGRAGALHAAEMARAQGFTSMEAVALHGVARLGDPWAVASLLGALAARGDGVLIPAMAAHAAALVRGEGDALLEATSAFESIGADLWAAEASEDAARAFQRGGRPARARAARARAEALAERCEGARTPALARSDVPEVLTSREQEIAQLAAAGFTSREIAAQLSVSVRTVDNHLQKVYAKLEVSNRRELGTILQPGGQERR
jgi:ATP/maltotriose-dependent transcriptional regulator MalT